MKRRFFCCLATFSATLMLGLPLGNPADPSLLCEGLFMCCEYPDPFDTCLPFGWSIKAGYYGDFVFDRHLEMQRTPGADIQDTGVYTNAGFAAFNLCNHLDLFATFGATKICLEANGAIFGAANSSTVEIETETNTSWSLGARATIWQCGCTFFGVEGQYFYTRPDINHVCVGCTQSNHPGHCIDFKYTEWQLGGGLAQRIGNFVPYLGVRYTSLKIDMDEAVLPIGEGSVFLHDLRRARNGGFSLGVSYIDCEKASITAEFRWPDEKALHISGQLRF